MTNASQAALRSLAAEARADQQLELENAIELAVASHTGQSDKQGRPYILHALRVMLEVDAMGAADLMPAAVLHDVIEDTDTTLEELPRHGVSIRTAHLVDILTREEGQAYADYIGRIIEDRQASIIKAADLKDNLGRLGQLADEAERVRLATRYAEAYDRIAIAHNL